MNNLRTTLLILSSLLALSACGSVQGVLTPDSFNDQQVDNTSELVSVLQSQSYTVETTPIPGQPVFQAAGTELKVNGVSMLALEYDSEEAATEDMQQIAADGSAIKGEAVPWAAPPHFFRNGNLMVLYVGNDETLISNLTAALGPQFAGR